MTATSSCHDMKALQFVKPVVSQEHLCIWEDACRASQPRAAGLKLRAVTCTQVTMRSQDVTVKSIKRLSADLTAPLRSRSRPVAGSALQQYAEALQPPS